ncbi:mechanosensitive ion channel protein MscS [Catellatospora sp. IY07-71]|uniref:mechanosensitive ion channel family protein n=1 Tax=Catellatospora sp. IY07-71 TaxID=2728827 RepID=UPI001BB45998|nr:mechanosensitive ion channel domain-containing protein [Catellatospora sp. IY07-71]BCJ73997.1 mechanosensitive ion channel protein MscS [Catellatospora sp. IY07-71]
MDAEQLIRAAIVVTAALLAAVAAGWLARFVVRRLGRRRYQHFFDNLSRSCRWPFRVLLAVVALVIALPFSSLTGPAREMVHHGLVIALIGASAWLAVRVLFVLEDAAFRRLPMDVADNRRMRRARTRIGILRRLTAVVVTLLAIAAILMTFAPLRTLGASLLASAGLAGVVAALAAQATLAHIFAGLQLAFTDELHIDDVVVVEGEWGRIEELRLTYVVVRLWDERRLVLPTTYFTTTPFQHWTRNESRVLGAAVLHLDHRMPVEPLRAEAERVVAASPHWDKRDWVLQVVDTTETTMVVRVLASAPDAQHAYDLRCEIREKLIAYVREHHPEGLPRTRVALTPPSPGDGQ